MAIKQDRIDGQDPTQDPNQPQDQPIGSVPTPKANVNVQPAPQSVDALTAQPGAPAPDPLAFAAPQAVLNEGGVGPGNPIAPAQDGASWLGAQVGGLPTANAAPTSAFSYTDPATGQPTQAASAADAPGQAGFASAPLIANQNGGNMTPQGTSANQFAGYVGPQGGGFGAGPSGDSRTALANLQQISGVDPSKFGLGPNSSPQEVDAITKQMAAIANRDPAAIDAAISSQNPFVRRVALSYKLGLGADGLDRLTQDAQSSLYGGSVARVLDTYNLPLETKRQVLDALGRGGESGSLTDFIYEGNALQGGNRQYRPPGDTTANAPARPAMQC